MGYMLDLQPSAARSSPGNRKTPATGEPIARLRSWSRGRLKSPNPARSKDVADAAQKDDGVTGRVRSIPLQFMVRDFDSRSDGDVRPLRRRVRPVIGDGREGF